MSTLKLRQKLQELMQYINDLDLANAFDEFIEKYKREKPASLLTQIMQ